MGDERGEPMDNRPIILKKNLEPGMWLEMEKDFDLGASYGVWPLGTKAVVRYVDPRYKEIGLAFEGFDRGHNLIKPNEAASLLAPEDNPKSGWWVNIVWLQTYMKLSSGPEIVKRKGIDFDSVILQDAKKQQIIHAIGQIDHHDLIFNDWGFGETFEKGRGISMLFYGPPGTGKTLMAQALADKLDYSLKIIGAADVQSSIPGEAERNLRKHFEEASDGKSILLFDECDSLIYDRSATGAILGAQVNELLSQLERFNGVTVFTTNRLGTLDEAVNRRLSVKIGFPMPTEQERVAIWKRMFPERAPIGVVFWKKLAKEEIAGGHIKNAVLRAARIAAAKDTPKSKKKITQADLELGLAQEIEATNEFHEAKRKFNKGGRAIDGLLHEGGKLSVENNLANMQSEVKSMKKKE